ncbi:MAG: DUF2799 domain-containing protein [Pseudomonadota bacterium]
MRPLIPLMAAALLAGCAAPAPSGREPLSPSAEAGRELCASDRRTAWGRVDAQAGYGAAQGLALLAACPGLSGERLDAAEDAYLAGHDQGRAAYCSPLNARSLGRRGLAQTLDCPEALQPEFDAAYAEGKADPRPRPWKPSLRPLLSVSIGSAGPRVGGAVGVTF